MSANGLMGTAVCGLQKCNPQSEGDVGVCDANSTGYKNVTHERVGNGLTVITGLTATLSFSSARRFVVFVVSPFPVILNEVKNLLAVYALCLWVTFL